MKNNTAVICLSPYSGGMEMDSIKLAKKLSPYVNITLIAKANHFIANQKDEYVGLNDIELETIYFTANLSFAIIFRVRKIIRAKNIKNVIFFGASELKSLYFAFLGFDINLIVRHGTTKTRPKTDWFHRLIYSNVNYHISICKHLQKNVEYIVPFGKNSKSVLIYPSLDIKDIKKAEHHKLTLAHVGRIARGKGQSDAIIACDVLVKNNIDFIFYIVGEFDEKYQTEFMKLYNSLIYKDKIKLVGFTKNVDSYLAKSDVFFFPSHGEGFGNAFVEAIYHKLFTITYRNTSFIEFKELGFKFEMADNKDINNLKEKLFYSVKNIKNYENDLEYNRELVLKMFSVRKEISKYLEILK